MCWDQALSNTDQGYEYAASLTIMHVYSIVGFSLVKEWIRFLTVFSKSLGLEKRGFCGKIKVVQEP